MARWDTFASVHCQGFVRVAAAVPFVRPADPAHNAQRTIELARTAAQQGVALVLFPELGLSAYAIDDLLHQQALADGTLAALAEIVSASRSLAPLLIVGMPLRAEGGLFNAAVVVHRGEVLGAVPKSYLPEYREYYEKRQFRAARDVIGTEVELPGGPVPFGADLIFECRDLDGFAVHVEICEDVWAPIPPSSFGAMAGATVLANLSASNITVGKSDYRHRLSASQSARAVAAYMYTAAGMGESTTDLAWDGQAMIYENGDQLAEAERYPLDDHLITADVDLDRLRSDRTERSSWGDSIHDHRERLRQLRRVKFKLKPPTGPNEAPGATRSTTTASALVSSGAWSSSSARRRAR